MALVTYDNSDSSDYDEENENVTVAITKPEELSSHPRTIEVFEENIETSPGVSLFNLLPQPTIKKPTVVEEDDEFLHKKEKIDVVKPKAKITVPSLKDFKDVDSPSPVPKPKSSGVKKSGLLSILPKPRNGLTTTTSKSLMPHVLKHKTAITSNKKLLPSPLNKEKVDKKLVNDYSDESDTDDVQNDFFSINKPIEVPIAEITEDINQDINKEIPSSNIPQRSKLESYFKNDPVAEDQVANESEPMEEYANLESSSYNMDAESAKTNEIAIDDEAIRKLCGTRGKRKMEDIQIVDVNQSEVLADAREWLIKGLMDDTTKRVSSSKKRGNEPTSQQKRKHQITYLAHQAKANEAELQNQWANSRMSRRQTQNKYGF